MNQQVLPVTRSDQDGNDQQSHEYRLGHSRNNATDWHVRGCQVRVWTTCTRHGSWINYRQIKRHRCMPLLVRYIRPLAIMDTLQAFNDTGFSSTFPALFQSKPSQSQHSKKEAVLANLRLYQRRGFTYEESLAFEKRKLLGRLCEQTLDVLTTGMNEIRAGQKEPSDDCLKKMAKLDEDKEGVYAVLRT